MSVSIYPNARSLAMARLEELEWCVLSCSNSTFWSKSNGTKDSAGLGIEVS